MTDSSLLSPEPQTRVDIDTGGNEELKALCFFPPTTPTTPTNNQLAVGFKDVADMIADWHKVTPNPNIRAVRIRTQFRAGHILNGASPQKPVYRLWSNSAGRFHILHGQQLFAQPPGPYSPYVPVGTDLHWIPDVPGTQPEFVLHVHVGDLEAQWQDNPAPGQFPSVVRRYWPDHAPGRIWLVLKPYN